VKPAYTPEPVRPTVAGGIPDRPPTVTPTAPPPTVTPTAPTPSETAKRAEEIKQQVAKAETQFGKRDEAIARAEKIERELPGLESTIKRQKLMPIAQQRTIREYEKRVAEYNRYVEQAGKYHTTGTTYIEKATGLARTYYPPAISDIRVTPESVVLPEPRTIYKERPFGLESRQLQAAYQRAVAPTPLRQLPPETRRLKKLEREAARLPQEYKPLAIEAERLRAIAPVAPHMPREEYEKYSKRFEKFEEKRVGFEAKKERLVRELGKYEPYTMTPERKRILLERAPLQVVPEAYGFLGGTITETILPKGFELKTDVEVPAPVAAYGTLFGLEPGRKYVFGLGKKEEAIRKAQYVGQFAGEWLQWIGVFKLARAVWPKPKVVSVTYYKPEKGITRFITFGEERGVIAKRPFLIRGAVSKKAFERTLGKGVTVTEKPFTVKWSEFQIRDACSYLTIFQMVFTPGEQTKRDHLMICLECYRGGSQNDSRRDEKSNLYHSGGSNPSGIKGTG